MFAAAQAKLKRKRLFRKKWLKCDRSFLKEVCHPMIERNTSGS
jgi:hypothetical protein